MRDRAVPMAFICPYCKAEYSGMVEPMKPGGFPEYVNYHHQCLGGRRAPVGLMLVWQQCFAMYVFSDVLEMSRYQRGMHYLVLVVPRCKGGDYTIESRVVRA